MLRHGSGPGATGRRRSATSVVVLAALMAACSSGPDDGAPARSALPSATTTTVLPTTGPVPTTTVPTTTVPTTTVPAATVPDDAAVCGGASIEARPAVYATEPGVDAERLSLDVYRPSVGEGCPVVMWVHGGGWHVGDKSQNLITTKAAWFTERGSVFVAINYRLASPEGGDVLWPAMGLDVARAVRWVVDNATSIGADPTDLTLIGHSAGAHLASAVAVDADLLGAVGLDRSLVRCLVVLDTAGYDLTRPMNMARPLVINAFGDDPAVLADASPSVQLRLHGGPVADTLVVVRGSRARVLLSEEYADAVRATGARAEVFDAGPLGHEDVNRLLGAPGDEVLTPVVASFLDGCV